MKPLVNKIVFKIMVSKWFKIVRTCCFYGGCLLLLSGCVTLFKSTEEVPALTITSSVPYSEVYLNGKFVGYTPYSHFGDKVDVKKITVKKAGYKTATQKARKLDKLIYWNFFPSATFIYGYFIDLCNDNRFYYPKDTFHFVLEKK